MNLSPIVGGHLDSSSMVSASRRLERLRNQLHQFSQSEPITSRLTYYLPGHSDPSSSQEVNFKVQRTADGDISNEEKRRTLDQNKTNRAGQSLTRERVSGDFQTSGPRAGQLSLTQEEIELLRKYHVDLSPIHQTKNMPIVKAADTNQRRQPGDLFLEPKPETPSSLRGRNRKDTSFSPDSVTKGEMLDPTVNAQDTLDSSRSATVYNEIKAAKRPKRLESGSGSSVDWSLCNDPDVCCAGLDDSICKDVDGCQEHAWPDTKLPGRVLEDSRAGTTNHQGYSSAGTEHTDGVTWASCVLANPPSKASQSCSNRARLCTRAHTREPIPPRYRPHSSSCSGEPSFIPISFPRLSLARSSYACTAARCGLRAWRECRRDALKPPSRQAASAREAAIRPGRGARRPMRGRGMCGKCCGRRPGSSPWPAAAPVRCSAAPRFAEEL